MMYPMMRGMTSSDLMILMGIKIFLLVWIIFVPIVITARLDKIAKLLEDKDK